MGAGAPSERMTEQEKQTAISAFTKLGICTQLAEAAAGLGWKAPSSIQEQAIPHLLAGEEERSRRFSARRRAAAPSRGSTTTSPRAQHSIAQPAHDCAGKDVIGLAQTGSGKTGAFSLPILQALMDKPQDFFALVLSPTRCCSAQRTLAPAGRHAA